MVVAGVVVELESKEVEGYGIEEDSNDDEPMDGFSVADFDGIDEGAFEGYGVSVSLGSWLGEWDVMILGSSEDDNVGVNDGLGEGPGDGSGSGPGDGLRVGFDDGPTDERRDPGEGIKDGLGDELKNNVGEV